MPNDRLLGLVLGAILAVIIGWVLYVGKAVLVPIVFAVLVVYVIIGVNRLLSHLPWVGEHLPQWLRSTISVITIMASLAGGIWLIANNIGRVIDMAPVLQASLLGMVQDWAARFGFETAPTWTNLRDDLLQQVNLRSLVGSTVSSVTSAITALTIVSLYVAFLLMERQVFQDKIRRLSDDNGQVLRIRQVLETMNSRIGTYLALKTLLSILLGLVSWVIMLVAGLDLAAFWAVLIAVLNYVPYIGSFLGVLFPIAFALVQFGDLGTVVMLFAGLVAAQFVIGNLLDPYVMGNSLNLSPFVILATLAIWSSLWGVAGAFLSVPMTVVVALALSEFEETRPIAVLLSREGKV